MLLVYHENENKAIVLEYYSGKTGDKKKKEYLKFSTLDI